MLGIGMPGWNRFMRPFWTPTVARLYWAALDKCQGHMLTLCAMPFSASEPRDFYPKLRLVHPDLAAFFVPPV